jgi:hypothetical protein
MIVTIYDTTLLLHFHVHVQVNSLLLHIVFVHFGQISLGLEHLRGDWVVPTVGHLFLICVDLRFNIGDVVGEVSILHFRY